MLPPGVYRDAKGEIVGRTKATKDGMVMFSRDGTVRKRAFPETEEGKAFRFTDGQGVGIGYSKFGLGGWVMFFGPNDENKGYWIENDKKNVIEFFYHNGTKDGEQRKGGTFYDAGGVFKGNRTQK